MQWLSIKSQDRFCIWQWFVSIIRHGVNPLLNLQSFVCVKDIWQQQVISFISVALIFGNHCKIKKIGMNWIIRWDQHHQHSVNKINIQCCNFFTFDLSLCLCFYWCYFFDVLCAKHKQTFHKTANKKSLQKSTKNILLSRWQILFLYIHIINMTLLSVCVCFFFSLAASMQSFVSIFQFFSLIVIVYAPVFVISLLFSSSSSFSLFVAWSYCLDAQNAWICKKNDNTQR